MTYHTPELLLVGAAQNVVLGDFKGSPTLRLNHDFDDLGYSTLPGRPFDSDSW